MTAQALRLGTRRSALALAQSGLVARAVTEATGRRVELVEITTHGDVSREALTQIGGTGVFVNALRDALLDGSVDFAVHSLKDLPTADPAGLALAAVPEREDVRDVLVAREQLKFADLSPGARVGTGSPRRAAQLRLLRQDLEIVPVRGNVDTRVGYVAKGELDAVVLAYAGLSRLGRLGEVTDYFDPNALLPAPGQGALALECRAADGALAAQLAALDHGPTRAAVRAERALLAALEAGCSAPVGGYATATADELQLTGTVTEADTPDAPRSIRMSVTGAPGEAERLGRELAARMLDQGAAGLMGKKT
ncbi:hydroxymethylbilane synthase [Actinocrinis puniceicyclus]|uniref:Porphobilinogen deaminase n=1 Tax=Actinocrinis puniceicyclus TaxID=977794 RepID=A0A8J8BFT8_9ACTN|nr:hydroxymethylbilane synthase [Actinocrinis puniceicyclus]MBS2965064.1 hydroxymethylbilane synthase [Actinocrinis puniceicyclus]